MSTIKASEPLDSSQHVCHAVVQVATTSERIAQALLRFSALSFMFLMVIGIYMSLKQGEIVNNQNLIIGKLGTITAQASNLNSRLLRMCLTPPARGSDSD
jgi:hypothetical protein